MDERSYLVKAQEAEAVANTAEGLAKRRAWEKIAEQYRQQARAMAERRGSGSSGDRSET